MFKMDNSKIVHDECMDSDIFDDSTLAANFANSSFRGDNLNTSCINLNVSALCSEKEISGFDTLTGRTWIYPTNYPIRDYQFNIIKAAILKNTLVSLPTGLGKTFIAAVIMYNFYRWYPVGKIIFTAPTKPLVAQQINACYNIVAIPPADTVEMTGHMQVNTRRTQWETKRVFFATPQVIYNDIKSGICPGKEIRCLIIDEAHKARGNYAYCQIINTLNEMGHLCYRVLALSATPGSKVDDVITVVRNLNIAHLELRTETSSDVEPYSHSRKINTIIVELGPQLNNLRQQYVEILDVYARNLKQLNILPQNVGNLSKGRIIMMYKEFQSRERGARHPKHNYIMKDFTFLISLFHGLELLVKHGSRVFLNFFDEHPEKSWIQSDQRLMAFLEKLRSDLGINPLSLDKSVLPDGTIPEIPKNLSFGHPKFDKLKEILLQHFNEAKQKGEETKAIVFCEYRESVNLVHCLLLQCRPLILPQMFVGQGASGKEKASTQRGQARALRGFRAGAYNALVCTCVAEEGLDVGQVDLILCFDVSTRSPIRLVQRCGRTGRSRGGQVYILVTEGREHQILLDSMRQRDGLNNNVLKSKEVEKNLFNNNPRMIPRGPFPECHKMYITVDKKDNMDKAKKGQKDLRSMLVDKVSSSNKTEYFISKGEFESLYPQGYRQCEFFSKPNHWAMNTDNLKSFESDGLINLSTWLDPQRNLQATMNIGHSSDTQILVHLLQYNWTKKDTPRLTETAVSTQESLSPNVFASPRKRHQNKKKIKPTNKSPGKRDGDIRAMFSTVTTSTKNYTKVINELGISNNGKISTKLINLFVDLNVENKIVKSTCWLCVNVCDCKIIQNMRDDRTALPLHLPIHKEPLPDISLIDNLSTSNLLEYVNNITSSQDNSDKETKNSNPNLCMVIQEQKRNSDINDNEEFNFDLDDLFSDDINNEIVEFDSKLSNLRETESISNVQVNKNLNCSKIISIPESSKLCDPFISDIDENKQNTNTNEKDANFDLGDIEDIFADSSSQDVFEVDTKKSILNNVTDNDKEDLEFFNLNSIEDLFEDSDIESPKKPQSEVTKPMEFKGTEKKQSEDVIVYPTSPSILSGRFIKSKDIPTSPILCSQSRKFNLSIKKDIKSSTPKSVRKLEMIKPRDTLSPIKKETSKLSDETTIHSISSKSMLTITQTIDLINRTKNNITSESKEYKDTKETQVCEKERSCSPILLTQRDRRRISKTFDSSKSKIKEQELKQTSVNIFHSENDSNSEINTQMLKLENEEINVVSYKPTSKTLKLDEINTSGNSQCFNKKPGPNKIIKEQEEQQTSLIILDSDSDSDFEISTQMLKLKNKGMDIALDKHTPKMLKLDETSGNSPYFNKKLEPSEKSEATTLQKKILAALTSNKFNNDSFGNNNAQINFMLFKSSIQSGKENRNNVEEILVDDKTNCSIKNNLTKLQLYRRESNFTPKNNLTNILTPINGAKRKMAFSDSDDDFDEPRKKRLVAPTHNNGLINHKMRKKKKQKTSNFLELEAELSGASFSSDELSEDSTGSIAEFICNDSTVVDDDDMQAHYLKSIKSPIKGVFKIPQLPDNFNKREILSQTVLDNDTYEMDSFCVDSHVGLTQANDMSELEIAEMILEEKRKAKRSQKNTISHSNNDSPIFRRKFKTVKKPVIESDSEDSS